MAGTVLGYMKFILAFDTVAFKKGMTAAERDVVVLQKKVEKFGKGMADIGKKMSIGLSAPLAAFAAMGIKEARETEAAMAQVRAGLASMGAVSGMTAVQLQKVADQMELHSLYEADEILRKVTTNLLTFGNLSGEMFTKTQQVVVDLATKMEVDLQLAALLVGKAMNDPIKGMAGLGRAGIQFTVAQKEVIKHLALTGQIAKAQVIIMAELQKQFGGSAQAAQDVDPYNALTDAIKNLAEQVGNSLLPYLKDAADYAVALAQKFDELDELTKGWLVTLGFIIALAGPVLYFMGNVVKIAAGFRLLVLFGAGLTGIGVGAGAAATGAYALGAAMFAIAPELALAAAAVWAVYEAVNAVNKLMGKFPKSMDKAVKLGGGAAAAAKSIGAEFKAADAEAAMRKKLSEPPDIAAPAKTKKAKKGVDEFKKMADNIRSVMDKLYPEAALQRQHDAELALLNNDAAMRKLGYSATQTADAIAKLNAEWDKDKAEKAKAELEKLSGPLKPILARLFPEQARAAEYADELKIVTENSRKLGLSADSTAEAIARLNKEFKAEPLKKAADAIAPIMDRLYPKTARANQFATDLKDIETHLKTLGASAPQIQAVIKDLTDEYVAETKQGTADVITAYGDMAVGVIDSTKAISETLKSGDLLGTLQHFLELVLNVVRTLAQLGVIGGSSGTSPVTPTPGIAGARARGGPVRGGSAYVVGENGPEIFSPRRGGYVHPNSAMGQARIMVVPSAYFDVVVDRRAANVAAPIAGQAAVMGMVGGEMRQARLQRRVLP